MTSRKPVKAPANGGHATPGSDELFRLLVESVAEYAIYALDPTGRVVSWNAGAQRIKGYQPHEIIGRHFSLFYTPEDVRRGEPGRALGVALSEGKYEAEALRVRKDGSRFVAQVLLTPLRDDDGNLRGFVKVTRDVTERKRAEDERKKLLSAERAMRKRAQRAMEDLRRLQVVTEAALAHLGLDELLAELLGRIREIEEADAVAILLRSDDGQTLQLRAAEGIEARPDAIGIALDEGLMARIAANGQALITEHVAELEGLRSIFREKRLRSILAAPLLVEGRLLGVIVVGSANRRRFDEDEARLLQLVADRVAMSVDHARLYGEVQQASRAKDDFMSVVSHELRTPLTAIMGWASLLRTRNFQPAVVQQGLETIELSAKAQAQLIDDLLDMSRVISGKLRLELRPIDLRHAVDAAVEAARPAAEAKGLKLQLFVEQDAYPARGDFDRLQQVVGNLLSNAIKFTPSGGRIEVSLRRERSAAVLSVCDTGLGIRPDFLPHVFERLQQADSSTTRAHGGLGLGLSIVRQLVEMHRGSVRADSAGEGKGATFTIELPLSVSAPRAEAASDGDSAHEQDTNSMLALMGVTVLLVEDEPMTRQMLATVLEANGASVTQAGAVPEALRTLEKADVDVIVSDIGMPGEDGYSLIRQVRAAERERTSVTPAIALTAFARGEDRRRALREGFQLHLTKPVDPAALAAAVATLAPPPEALTSPVTRMPDRRLLDPYLDRQLSLAESERQSVGVIKIHLDGLTRFRAKYGGDAVTDALGAFLRTVHSALRLSDTVARSGGDELVVLVRHADMKGTIRAAERIRDALRALDFGFGRGDATELSAYFAVTNTAVRGFDRATVLAAADAGLERARSMGSYGVAIDDDAPASTPSASATHAA